MGHISTDVTFTGSRAQRTFRNVLVDTGATWSVVSPATVKALGGQKLPGRFDLELGNGRRIRAAAIGVRVRLAGREGPTLVLSFRGAKPVIGVETLEGLGLGVDIQRRRLVRRRATARALFYGTTSFRR